MRAFFIKKGLCMQIYFSSDLHLGHRGIIDFQNRPFQSVEEMNRTLIHNFNSVIHANDVLYLLGDVTHRIPESEANGLIKKLKGRKILIRGNHDGDYDPTLFEGIYDYKEFNHEKMKYVLMHYPLMEWNRSRHNSSIHLHGHIHSDGQYNEENRVNGILRYDVGVDANHYYPVSLQYIQQYFAESIRIRERGGV